MPGEHLDLTSDPHLAPREESAANSPGREPSVDNAPAASSPCGRKFVGIHFVCCDRYGRIYLNRQQSAYEGHCPKCSKKIRIAIGPGGTSSRFFTAG